MGTLDGRVVVVTRPRDEAGRLVALLEDRGARTLVAPAIRIVPAPARPLDRAVAALAGGAFDWVVFTSRAGVEALFGHLAANGFGPAAVRAHVAAVGEGTARALAENGRRADLVPATFTTDALARALPRGHGKVLLARADIAPEALEAGLASKGWEVERVDAYRTRLASRLPADVRRALVARGVHAITFTSASTVEGFARASEEVFDLSDRSPRRPKIVCIGPVTSRRARALGWRVDAVATPHTIDGLVGAVERTLRAR